jgi:hypothetical protein
MAVLTIKGKTTNDSVAIKNPTGDKTYFTAGETSATLSSDVTGTLGSGITLGSGVAFPTGHVLQMLLLTTVTEQSSTGSYTKMFGSGAEEGTNCLKVIKTADTKILLMFSSQVGHSNSDTYLNNTKIERDTSASFPSPVTVLEDSGGNAGARGDVAENRIGTYSNMVFDSLGTESSGDYFYRVQFKGNASTVYFQNASGHGSLLAMEIRI